MAAKRKEIRRMKRFLALCVVALWAAGLVGCAQKNDTTVVWQKSLPQSGVQVELSNCTLLSEEPIDYVPNKEIETDRWDKMDAIAADGSPVLTFYNVEESQVKLAFLTQIDSLYCGYDKVYPQIKIDYILTENEDGSLSYRFDTVTPFAVTVTSDSGSDTFALLCERKV